MEPPPTPECPPPEHLEQLVATGARAGDLRDHVESCPRCGERVAGLRELDLLAGEVRDAVRADARVDPAPPLGSARRRVRKGIAISAIVLCVAAVGADVWVGVRYIEDDKYGDLYLPPFGRFDRPWERLDLEKALAHVVEQPEVGEVPYPAEGWVNEPGQNDINSIGARSRREFAPRPADGVLRVACYGDSFTFGAEAAIGQAWPNHLDRMEDDLEVVNMGVRGYGTDQALMLFRRTAPALRPDVVVVGLLLENVSRNVNRIRSMLYVETAPVVIKPRFVLEDGELVLVPIPYETRAEAYRAAFEGTLRDEMIDHEYWAGDDPLLPFSSIERILRAKHARERRRTGRLWRDTEAEPYRVTLAILQAFDDEARAMGASDVVVVVFPEKLDLEVAAGPEAYHRALLDDLDARGIAYLDAAPLLAPLEDGAYKSQHLSPAGNHVVAAAIRDWLRDRHP